MFQAYWKCAPPLLKRKNDKITAFLDFEILKFLQIETLESLYNQLLLQFLSSQSKTVHKCFRHIEDVHFSFLKRQNLFFGSKLQHFWTLKFYSFLIKHYVSLWNVCLINSF